MSARRTRSISLPAMLLLGLALSTTLPASAQPATAPVATTTAAPEPRFDILEFIVEGDTALGAVAIERAVYPFLGPQRTAADAEGARRALEKTYQDAGFLSVNVVLPEQRVDNAEGALRLQVVEAAVDRLRVTGARYTLPSEVRSALPNLAPGTVPHFGEMQDELAALSRSSADRSFTPLITAGTEPGRMNVEMQVQERSPLHASIELNNRQSPNTRAGRLEANLRYDNLFQRGHSIGLDWFYSPRKPEEADIRSLNYHFPLGGPGDRMYLMLTHSDSNTPTPLGGATVSRGETWRLRWRDALQAPEGISHALSWGLTLRDLQDRNQGVAGFAGTDAPALRYPTFQIAYDLDLTDTTPGATAGRQTSLQTQLGFSLPGLSRGSVDCYGTVMDQFACKRAGATPAFQVLGLTLAHREPLGRWTLDARLQAQLADAPLVSAEQVVYGGMDSVRGYYEGEFAGDLGAALRLELSTPPWQPTDNLQLRAQGFYDRAVLRRLEPLPTEVARTSIASTGIGLVLDARSGLRASLHWARILPTQGSANASASGRRHRVEFALRQSF